MKRLIGLIAVILITATSASGLVNTNSVNITVGDTAGHNYKQFDFTWSGFDDQSITFALDRVITNHTWTFKLTKDTITGQVAYVSQAASVSTSNITLSLSRTNVPPNASYKASLRGVDATSTLGIDVARGKVSVTDSLFDDADGTYVFPATLDVDAADTSYVNAAGDGMTGGLTNTTARGFVGNGGNLTNVTSTGVSAASLTEAMLKAVDTASDEDYLTFETTTGDFEWHSLSEVDHGGLGGLGDDDHTGYRLESADHTHASTGMQAGQLDHGSAITGLTDDDHTIYRLESADHTHASTGMQAGKIDHGAAIDGLTDDDHTQYRLESADHTHATTGAQAGTIDHGALDGRGDDDHSLYLQNTEISTSSELAGLLDNETGSGLSVFATSPTLTTPSIATSLTVTDDDWIGLGGSAARVEYDDTTVDLVEILAGNVRIGDGTPSNATAVEELYVEGDIEGHKNLYLEGATPSLNFVDSTGSEEDWQIISGAQTINGSSEDGLHFIDVGDTRIDASITDTDGNFHLGIGYVVAERQVVVATGAKTLSTAEAMGGFITMNASNTINLPATATAGMEVTILVIADVAVTIADNAAGDLIWKDGSTDTSIVCSGSAGECITLTFVGSLWYAHTIEGSWILQ